jgi:acetyltransferase-like isoleucine patch superfamily enzyme
MKSEKQHINVKERLLKVFKSNPFEIMPIISTGLKTLQYRYIQKCIGKKSIVGRRTEILNYSRVKIGSHCLIQDHVYIRAGIEGKITIGDYCAINSFAKLFGHGGIEIGDYTQIGPGCLLTTTTHDYQQDLKTGFKKIDIGENVWIGANCIILADVTIEDHSVIGAGSVVNRSIPQYSVAVGSPARVIKEIKKRSNLNKLNEKVKILPDNLTA